MDTGGFFVALLKKVKPLGKQATERMNALARESRGGVEVDGHYCKSRNDDDGEKGEEKKSVDVDNNAGKKEESEGGDATMTESSVAEDKTDTEPAEASKDDDAKATSRDKPKDEGKEEKEEPTVKAPMGKVGVHHKHKKKADLGKEDFIPVDPSIWSPMIEEYGLASTFPKDQFMVRACGEAKILYFISKSIKEDLIDHGIQDRVTVINSGLKAFERCSLKDKNLGYRLAQEGIQYVVPHVTKRILTADMDDFYACVKEGFLPFDNFSESFQKGLEELTTGSFLVTLKGYEKDIAKKMYLSMWRRPDSHNNVVNCFVSKIEMEAVLSKMRALGYVPPVKEEEEEEKKEEANGSSTEKKPATEDKMEVSS